VNDLDPEPAAEEEIVHAFRRESAIVRFIVDPAVVEIDVRLKIVLLIETTAPVADAVIVDSPVN